MRLRLLFVAASTSALIVVPAVAASAHPLGNFTVNHYDGLVFLPDRIDDTAVVDSAEIPTAQARDSVDANHDGTVSAAERAAYAVRTCRSVAASLVLTTGVERHRFSLGASSYTYRPGAAGLHISRLVCALTTSVDLTQARTVDFSDPYRSDRIGWHEITAVARGTHLRNSPVPQTSVSDTLLHYPNDLLSSPLNVRSGVFSVVPGPGLSTIAAGLAKVPGAGPLSRLVEDLNRTFSSLAGAKHLTVGVGLLAVLISLLLGASHAALPGHGKTVMAAYLAGKRGRVRDAVVVGATVTVTHTVGVLALGLALTLSSSLAGDKVTNDLGVVSGLLIAFIGIGLLSSAIRRRRGGAVGHSHDHDHGHVHAHHEHDAAHDHAAHDHAAHDHAPRQRRAGLVGMGVAGGLVPSPSALVVLLGAVALGRTVFGVLLVITYGLGMAATLTAAGLLLVKATTRYGRRLGRTASLGRRFATAGPWMTASLVVVVGLGLAARSFVAV